MAETAGTVHEPEFVRLGPAARRLDVRPATLVAAIKRGELRGFRSGERKHQWCAGTDAVVG